MVRKGAAGLLRPMRRLVSDGVCEDVLKFACLRVGGMLIWQRAGEDHRGLLDHLLSDPDRLLDAGERLPGRGRGCTTARVTVAGSDFLLKRFAYRNVWYGLRHIFKRSRAFKVFVNQNLAYAAGVSVPRPFLCLEERCWRFLRRGYVLDSYLHESRQLDQCWDELTESDQNEILRQSADNYCRLHQAGILHGDSNWRNLLVVRTEAGPKVWMIDFDNSRRLPVLSRRLRQRDINHFVRDMRWRCMPEEQVESFVARLKIQ